MSKFVGIDLGTTYSVVAYVNEQGKPEVIANQHGKATTPSVIYFAADSPIVGDEAKEQQAAGETEVASFFKRSMGDDQFLLSFYGRDYTPLDLLALVLAYMKQQAESFLGDTVSDAVVTVPAYFTHTQRTATIEAGHKAGLHILKIISEPTAAALAYGIRPTQETQQVLVYDLGGGTLDVSLVEITATELTVIATDGDHNFGGKDWDDRLLSYLADQFEQEFGVELLGDDVNELRVQAKKLKHALSARQSAEARLQASGKKGTYKGALLRKQQGKCRWCELLFQDTDVIEIDHITSTSQGGGEALSNKCLLHRHCHDERHAQQVTGLSDKDPIIEEPDAGKLACPVCAVRRVVRSLPEAGGMREEIPGLLAYLEAKAEGDQAC